MKGAARAWVPLAIVTAAGLGVGLMFALRPSIEPDPPKSIAPLIRVVTVQAEDFVFIVEAQGTVAPRTESDLVPQVSGEVVWVSPNLVAGGFFELGEPLLRIDPADYEAALESARANTARAESERSRARKEQARQRRLADRSVASQSRIDDAENGLRVADASLREKRAQMGRASRDLSRTELSAPYAGRVRRESVDVGQFASRGQPLAGLYAVDYAEVRLPLPDRELAYLDLSLAHRSVRDERSERVDPAEIPTDTAASLDTLPGETGPEVLLHADFAGGRHTWRGRIVRTEGEIDPKSRMVNVVARVEDPYGRADDVGRPPLAVGLFVEAEIIGRVAKGAFVVPRAALRRRAELERPDRVFVVDADSRLRFRDVEVLRVEREQAVIGRGLFDGDLVNVSPLRAVVDGMRVRIAPDEESAPTLAGARP